MSNKGTREAYAEIELEPTAHAPTEAPPAARDESPFEVFTREPRRPAGKAGSRPPRPEARAFTDVEFETTAYVPGDAPPASAPELLDFEPTIPQREPAPAADELPLEDFMDDLPPALPPPPPPVAPVAPVAEVAEVAAEVVAPPPPPDSRATTVVDEFEGPFNLEEELPRIDLAREVEPEASDEGTGLEGEETTETAPGRGVFDTETLATIYVNQGFYGRAAEIFQRLLEQRPGDAGLRRKLDDVLALERVASPPPAPVAPPPRLTPPTPPTTAAATAPAASPERAGDLQVRRLQTLLDAFRGGRPQ